MTTVWLWSPDEQQCWPVYDWASLKVTQERFGAQYLEITARRDSQLVQTALGSVAGQEFYGYGLWVYHDAKKLLFDGPVLQPVLKGGADTGSAYVTLEVEGHLNAALRRRLVFSASLTDLAMPPTAPNSIAVTLIDQCMGGGTGPIYPVGYPGGGGGPLRTDFLAQTYQAGLAVGAPVPVPYYAQPGKNLQDTIEDLCLRYDMCPVMQRAGPALRRIDVQYPYEANDRTGTVVLTRLRGSLTAYEATVPYTLTTVARSAGAGSGATQVSVWQANNWPVYGVHEDQLTTPAGASGACTQDVQLILRASNPLIAYKVEVRDTANVKWGSDYFWRDGVLIYDDDYGQTIDQTIIAYTYEATNGGRAWSLQVELAERETAMLRYMAGRTGVPFGRSSGGKWKDTRG